jgi:hypothetical protein
MTYSILLFRAKDNQTYVLTDDPRYSPHTFDLLTQDSLQKARIFPDENFGRAYPDEMIRRGVWDDFGVMMHVWNLRNGDTITQRIYTSEAFIDGLVKRQKYAKSEENLKTMRFYDEHRSFGQSDDVGFLDASRYEAVPIKIDIGDSLQID